MALSFQVRLKTIRHFNKFHHRSSCFPIIQSKHLPSIHTKFKSFSTKTNKDDSDDDIFEEVESEKESKPKFDFEDDFDDFESFQKRKRNKQNDTSNYYHEYFANKSADQQNAKSEEVKDRKRLKKPKGARKTDKEREEEADMSRLKIEYRFIAAFIGGFCALTAYYFYYISGSKIGKADTYYKAAIDYELKIDTFEDENERNECIQNADFYYKKAMKFTDYSFPKYLHKYAEFLLLYKSDYSASEHYITKALGLHSTNAIYHKFYCKLLKEQIEKNGQIERLQDYYSQKNHTIDAHMREAQYFLDEENNAKAAIMHFDYALNFCDLWLKNDGNNESENMAFRVKEDDMRDNKRMTYQNAATLLQEYGFNDEANGYWQDGIKEFGEPLEVMFGVNLYENQKFDEAMEIFEKYGVSDADGTRVNVNVSALAFKGRILMELGHYEEAMDIYSKILMRVGLDSMVIGDIIFILIKLNKMTDARNLMKQVIGLIQKKAANDDLIANPEYKYLNMIHVLLMGKLDDIESANWQCLEMVNKYPNSFEVNYIAALYYDECAKNYDKADRYYRTAISIEPKWAKVYYHYALFFKKNNDLGQFAKYIKLAYEKNDKIPAIKALYSEYFDDEGRLLHNVAL